MRHKKTAALLAGLAFAIAAAVLAQMVGSGTDGLFAGGPAPTPTAKPGADGSLSGVYDALVHPNDKSVGLHHCILRLDHDAGDDRAKGAAVCYIDTLGLNPGSDLPEHADGVPGPPPPPPYTTSAPTKLEGSYDSGTDTLTLAGCWSNIGGSLGPNAILEITVPNAKASLPDLAGSVLIYGEQSVAACDSATPKGPAPSPDSLSLNRAMAERDFDGDGCTDSDELSKPGPSGKCGDDPYNPHDSDDIVEAVGNLLITVERADWENESEADIPGACDPGNATSEDGDVHWINDGCPEQGGSPETGGRCSNAVDDDGDGFINDGCPAQNLIGGSYYHCITDTQDDNETNDLTVRVFCYTDSPAVTVNCQDADIVFVPPCSVGASACQPLGDEPQFFCGDGLPGSSPPKVASPRQSADVDSPHTQLSGVFDKDTNQLSITGCFQNIENAFEGPSIYWDLAVNGQTGQGTVDVYLRQDPADCKADTPSATPDGLGERLIDDALIETVEQAPRGSGWDTDGDNCPDEVELGDVAGTGGLRDPYNRWDWMDQWIGFPDPQMDGSGVIGDILAVVARFGSVGALGDPKIPPLGPLGYHAQADRGGSLFGSAGHWNLKPPDGSITIGDILVVVAHFGHAGCASKSP